MGVFSAPWEKELSRDCHEVVTVVTDVTLRLHMERNAVFHRIPVREGISRELDGCYTPLGR